MKARENLKKRETRKFNRLSQEMSNSHIADDGDEKGRCVIELDHKTGAGIFKRKEVAEKVAPVDEFMSLTPKLSRCASVSVNTSKLKQEAESKRTSTFSSHPGGKLHPALPRFGVRRNKQTNVPTKSDLIDLRQKNPTVIKNAIYCIVILEEFVKELAAVSIEQTLL